MHDMLQIVLQRDTFYVKYVRITDFPLMHVVIWLPHVFNVLQTNPGSDFAGDELHTTLQVVVNCDVYPTQQNWIQKQMWRRIQMNVINEESELNYLRGGIHFPKSLTGPILLKVAGAVQATKVWCTTRVIVSGSLVTLKLPGFKCHVVSELLFIWPHSVPSNK